MLRGADDLFDSSPEKAELSPKAASAGTRLGDAPGAFWWLWAFGARWLRGFRCECRPGVLLGAWAGLCGLPLGARGDAAIWAVDMWALLLY